MDDAMAFGVDSFVNESSFLPSWDKQSNSFAATSNSSTACRTQNHPSSRVPVRYVHGKKLLAKVVLLVPHNNAVNHSKDEVEHEVEAITTNSDGALDVFSGIIDAVSGEILYGTRRYAYTGELFEGPFRNNGQRHGEGVIVRNMFNYLTRNTEHNHNLNDPPSATLTNNNNNNNEKNTSRQKGTNFFGSYRNDKPHVGTFVTDQFTYKGSFQEYLFHGAHGEFIHGSGGYMYRGEFQNGLAWGRGVETDLREGEAYEYHGEFQDGMRWGKGSLKELLPEDRKDQDTLYQQKCVKRREEQKKQEKYLKLIQQQFAQDIPSSWEDVENNKTSTRTRTNNDNDNEDSNIIQVSSKNDSGAYPKHQDVRKQKQDEQELDLSDLDLYEQEDGKLDNSFSVLDRMFVGEVGMIETQTQKQTVEQGETIKTEIIQPQRKSSMVVDNMESRKWETSAAASSNAAQTSLRKVNNSTRYTYSGSFESNLRQGEGKENTPSGELYTGQFVADQRHGCGSLENLYTHIVYQGRWQLGNAVHGNGWRVLYPSGDIFVGCTDNLLPNGYGIYRHKDADTQIPNIGQKITSYYMGEWKDGKRHGMGVKICNINDPPCCKVDFVGKWKHDKRVNAKRPEETNGTLRDMAQMLQEIEYDDSVNSDASEPISFDALMEQDPFGALAVDKDVQFSNCLKQAMAASLNESLQLVGSELPGINTYCNEESFLSRVKEHHNANNKGTDEIEGSSSDHRQQQKQRMPLDFHTYSNEDAFLGTLDPLTTHRIGFGVHMSHHMECIYTGDFHNNLRHGDGILVHLGYGRYVGEFSMNLRHGLGTWISEDSSCYHGGFINDVFEGIGILCRQDGSVYVGAWKDGLKHGGGVEILSGNDVSVYHGGFKHGERHGNGTLVDNVNGQLIYSGEWCKNKYHGQGVSIDRHEWDPLDRATGNSGVVAVSDRRTFSIRYEGEFNDGKWHGYGILTSEADCTIKKGMWKDGEPTGRKWRVTYSDGGIYAGRALVMDKRQAKKSSLTPLSVVEKEPTDGDEFIIDFCTMEKIQEDDVPSKSFVDITVVPDGFGNMKYRNGDVYVGEFVKGVRCGVGTCLFANGDKWEGVWTDDNFVDKSSTSRSKDDAIILSMAARSSQWVNK